MHDVLFGATVFFNDPAKFPIILEVEKRFPFIKYLEFRGEHPFCFPDVTEERHFKFYRETMEQTSLRSTMHTTMYDINLATLNPWLKAANIECYKRYIDLSAYLGSEVIVVHGGYLDHDFARDELREQFFEMARQNLCESLESLAEYGSEKSVRLALENSPPEVGRSIVYDAESHLQILQRVDHPNCGALLDFAHAFLRRLDIIDYLERIRPWLFEIHAHNNLGENDDHLGLTHGKIDYEPILDHPDCAGVPFIMEIKSYDEVMETLIWLAERRVLSAG